MVCGSRLLVDGCWLGIVGLWVDGLPQAVLSFGPSAPLHPPPAALRLRVPALRVPAYGRGWPGSSGQHRLRPCISTPSHFLLHLPPSVVCSTGGTASSIVLRTFRSAPSPPRCASLAGTRLRPRVHGQGPSTCVRFGTIGIRADGLFQIAHTLDYNNRLLIRALSFLNV